MNKLEIKEVNGRFALYKDNCSIDIAAIMCITYRNFSYVQCRILLKKFNIETVFLIASKNKSDLEHFSNFLESRYFNE